MKARARMLTAPRRMVDTVVGGQWGSEGKGSIASYLAPEYNTLMRVGGPNAGHYVLDDDGQQYCHRQLPSGGRRESRNSVVAGLKPLLLVGPGATINVELMLKEIRECDAYDRVMIHPQAALISDQDVRDEQKLAAEIGSTAQGVGRCAARRILRDVNNPVGLAGECEALRAYIGDTTQMLGNLYTSKDERLLLEATQGTALSLYHGSYPHVTSRDTTVAGTCAEAGIAPNRVNRTYMVIRTYPIRVGTGGPGVSGPMPGETSWDKVAAQAGLDPEFLKNTERGSVSKITRRVAEFDCDQVKRAAMLNGATDLALTFADYIDPANAEARTYHELSRETRDLIEKIEDTVGIGVSLVSVGFFPGCIIDRRAGDRSSRGTDAPSP